MRPDLESVYVATFAKYLDAATRKRQAGEDYERELIALNLMMIPAGFMVCDVEADGTLQTGKLRPEQIETALSEIQRALLDSLDANKLPRA